MKMIICTSGTPSLLRLVQLLGQDSGSLVILRRLIPTTLLTRGGVSPVTRVEQAVHGPRLHVEETMSAMTMRLYDTLSLLPVRDISPSRKSMLALARAMMGGRRTIDH